MNEENKISIPSDLKPVSFTNCVKDTLQIKLIVALITKSINENNAISIEDIINCYTTYKLNTHGKLTKELWLGYSHVPQSKRVDITQEEFKALYGTKMAARQWFKSNLGSAIIRGKLLVIPIIEI